MNDFSRKLIFLRDGQLTIPNADEDIRGRKALNKNSEEIGTIEDLLVDERERKVRFMEVSAVGHFGFRGKKFLLPVEAIKEITDDFVKVDQSTQKIKEAPPYNPEIVDEPYLSSVYTHYAFVPYWGLGRTYLPYPYYPRISKKPRDAA